jgi:hypothetical protein
MAYTFSYFTHQQDSTVRTIDMEVSEEASLREMLDAFTGFLKAATYVIRSDEELRFVREGAIVFDTRDELEEYVKKQNQTAESDKGFTLNFSPEISYQPQTVLGSSHGVDIY